MDVLNTADPAVPVAADALPAAPVHHTGGALPAGAEISLVLLMDVGMGMGGLLPAAHHLLGQLRGEIQVQHSIRSRQTQLLILEVKEPVHKGLLLLRRKLGGLVNGVGGGIAVGDEQTALLIVAAPVLFIGGVAVHGVEGRSGIGIDIAGLLAEGSAQIEPHQRRGFLLIPGEGQLAVGNAPPGQLLTQQLRLRSLAGTVGPLKYDELSLHGMVPPVSSENFITLFYHSFPHLSTWETGVYRMAKT